jgi:hypothetical protein
VASQYVELGQPIFKALNLKVPKEQIFRLKNLWLWERKKERNAISKNSRNHDWTTQSLWLQTDGKHTLCKHGNNNGNHQKKEILFVQNLD